MTVINTDDIVQAVYNTGTYIGKVIEDRGNFFLVEVLAVDKHPTQGDLHNPGKVENVLFHERKALAHREKMNARKRTVEPYDKEIPTYSISLKKAVDKLKAELLAEDTAYSKKAMEKLKDLETHFYLKTDY